MRQADNNEAEKRYDRRGFFRAALRACALGGLGATGLYLFRQKPGPRNQTCVADGICSRCRNLQACELPQALSMKAAKNQPKGNRGRE